MRFADNSLHRSVGQTVMLFALIVVLIIATFARMAVLYLQEVQQQVLRAGRNYLQEYEA